MGTSLKRLAAGIAGGLLAAVVTAPLLVASAATQENVPNLDEAWYVKAKEPLGELPSGDPTCTLPTGCNAAGNVTRPNNPRPENTLQVGVISGQEDASAAFTLDTSMLPPLAVVTGGKSTLVVAGSDAGTQRQDEADMVACFTTGTLVSSQDGGNMSDRPAFDCETSAPLVKVEGAEKLTFEVDLAPFAARWAAGEANNGISLLVSEAAKADRKTFNIAFAGKRREGGTPITSTITYEVPADTAGGGTSVDSGSGSGFDSGASSGGGGFGSGSSGGGFDSGSSGGFSSGGFTGGGGFSSGSSGGSPDFGTVTPPVVAEDTATAEEPAIADEAAIDEPVLGDPVETVAAEEAVPGTNPLVWFLPLLGLTTAGALAWSLSQPVELIADRQGAVSRLMARRRGGLVAGA